MKTLFVILALTFFTAVSMAQQTTYQNPPPGPEERHVDNITKSGDVGVGLMLGVPYAANVKFWTAETRAVNANVAYEQGDMAIMLDYEWNFRRSYATNYGPQYGADGRPLPNTETRRPASVVPYLGIGALAVFNTNGGADTSDRPLWKRTDETGPGFGIRVPLGIEYLPVNFPAGVFAEVAPGTIFAPNNFNFVQGDLGARYYF